MHIGLIGGIGPAATDYYYRRLISTFASNKAELELTIVHADASTLVSNLAANDTAAQTAIYDKLTQRLAAAGADCVAVTSIGGHFCIDDFKAIAVLPVVDMLVEVSQAIAVRGYRRIGILGTRTAMETRFYGKLGKTEVLAPEGEALHEVHQAYVTMATAGVVTDQQRWVFDAAIRRLLAEGAEAVLLGGTDLALAYDERTAEFPLIDAAGIHADAIARWATQGVNG